LALAFEGEGFALFLRSSSRGAPPPSDGRQLVALEQGHGERSRSCEGRDGNQRAHNQANVKNGIDDMSHMSA